MKCICKCSTLIIWFGYLPTILYAMSLNRYASVLSRQADRTYYPTPKSLCDVEPYRSTRSCYLLRTNKRRLRSLSDKYLRYDFNYWKRVESTDIAVTSSHDLNTILQTGTNSSRKKRSIEAKRRQKRNTVTYNPCSNEIAARTTMFYGRDANTGEVLEILQNPGEKRNKYRADLVNRALLTKPLFTDRRLYQTFFTHSCSVPRYFWMVCEVHYVIYLAAVFKPNSDTVHVRPVKIPTSCALRAIR
uniref:uncharacterized protein LOC113474385 isoform X1 n=1 Tax=Ciona intestinalis TaxID=7719 RepID=UPI000EF54696|nr:uncharacterized protein LOC113474385 isoform X1 [Ciona intestinalis]|eukprot:XP_026691015.1 uncharacterized protein LOC113474385 isoform X1 [Ciona intestinalis]